MRTIVVAGFIIFACAAFFVGTTDAALQSNADADWQQLTSSDVPPDQQPGEDSLAYFMRRIQMANLRRRELGVKFWHNYPGDPRRYSWLLLTVHLAPRYPSDLGEWAKNEASPRWHPYRIDAAAAQRWENIYPSMREAFWNSPSVTEHQRRYLRYGEIQSKLDRLLENPAATTNEDKIWLVEQCVGLAADYPGPLSALDSGRLFLHEVLLEQVFANALSLGIDTAMQLAFAERLQTTGHPQAAEFGKSAARRLRTGKAASATGDVFAQVARRPLSPRLFEDDHLPVDWSVLLNTSSAQAFNTDCPEGSFVYFYQQYIITRKFREFGLKLWKTSPDRRDRMKWLADTKSFSHSYYGALFLKNVEDGVRLLAADPLDPGSRAGEVQIDEGEEKQWDRQYAEMRDELLNSDMTTEHDRSFFRSIEFPEKLLRAARRSTQQKDRSGVDAILNEIRGCAEREDPFGAAMLQEVFKRHDRLGLSVQEMADFVTPLVNSKEERVREFAVSQQRLLALRNTPVELKGITLQGQPFDLSSMRGKIVLIDYWSTTCGTCILAFPRIKAVYDRYKYRGFEVISVCLNGSAERSRVERIKERLDLTWTTLAADGLFPELQRRYGYQGFPEYMLLDRNGKLVAASAEIQFGRNLEALLKRMMNEE